MTSSKSPSNNGSISSWLVRWLFFWLCSFIVFQSAILTPRKIPHFLLNLNDKAVHGAEYFLLAISAVLAFKKSRNLFLRGKAFPAALLYGAAMGAATEMAQLHVPGRSCDLRDWLADFAGTAAALLLAAVLLKLKDKK